MATAENRRLDDAYISLVTRSQLYDLTFEEAAVLVARECVDALSVCRASVWLLSDDQSQMRCVALHTQKGDGDNGMVLDTRAFPRYLDALLGARIIDASDAFNDARTSEFTESYLAPLNILSMLDGTIRRDGRVCGILCVESTGRQRNWNTDEKTFVASVADLVTQRLIAAELESSEKMYRALFDNTNVGIAVFGEGQFIEVNPAICSLFGAPAEQIVGKTPTDVSPEFQPCGELSSSKAMRIIETTIKKRSHTFEWLHQKIDGTQFHAEITGNVISADDEEVLFALIRDISARKEAEQKALIAQQQLEYRATHDPLTGLMNRGQFHPYVNELIDRHKREGKTERISLFLFDLNRFKEINDTLGHSMGDRVLVRLSVILKNQVQEIGGALFRLGGDEFVAVFCESRCVEPFESLEQIITQSMRTTIDLDDISVEMGASIGIAMYPDNGADSHELLRCADVAMYHAKQNEGTSSWYDPANDMHNKRRLAMMVELGSAIREDQLTLHFQPRISLSTGQITGCEALVRWKHPRLGMVSPGEFLPLAEMSDLIHPLSEWVLHKVFATLAEFERVGCRMPIALNLSPRNLTDLQLVGKVEALLDANPEMAGMVEIEITEGALINHPQRALQNLNALNDMSIPIAIDDFGTGYSSLSYLKKLPVQALKVDRSFVDDMLNDRSDMVIVESVINLARNFSLQVVAEGVENEQTLKALSALGCDEAQGFHIARPMPADDFCKWALDYMRNGAEKMRALFSEPHRRAG